MRFAPEPRGARPGAACPWRPAASRPPGTSVAHAQRHQRAQTGDDRGQVAIRDPNEERVGHWRHHGAALGVLALADHRGQRSFIRARDSVLTVGKVRCLGGHHVGLFQQASGEFLIRNEALQPKRSTAVAASRQANHQVFDPFGAWVRHNGRDPSGGYRRQECASSRWVALPCARPRARFIGVRRRAAAPAGPCDRTRPNALRVRAHWRSRRLRGLAGGHRAANGAGRRPGPLRVLRAGGSLSHSHSRSRG